MRSVVLIALAASLAGCLTPSIPIPPPDPTKMEFDIDTTAPVNTAVFSYPADDRIKDSIVFVFNRDQGEGIIVSARADGSVGPTKPFPAIVNDQVVVTFQNGDQTVSTCIRIRQGTQSPTAYCD
jgi:hypothetical protein